MAENPKDAWTDVGDRASGLAKLVSERLKGAGTTPEAAQDADAVKDTLTKLKAFLGDVTSRATSVVHDQDVRDHLSGLAVSLDSALNATVERVGASVDEHLGRNKGRPPDAGGPDAPQ